MGYYFDSIFKDRQLWLRVVFFVVLVLGYYDLRVKIFGGMFVKYVLIIGFVIGLSLIIYKLVNDKKDKALHLDQQNFERKKRIEFREIVRRNPEFKTLCFECDHFKGDIRACGIHMTIRNKRALKTRFQYSEHEYCLYWNRQSVT